MLFSLLVQTVLVPAGVSLLTLAVLRASGLPEPVRGCGGLGALGLGYLAGHVAIAGLPSMPPLDTTQGLVYLVLAALILGLLEARLAADGLGRWISRLALVAVLLGLTLHPLIRHQWGVGRTAAWLLGLTPTLLVLWAAYRWLGERLGRRATSLSWSLAFVGSGILLVLSRTALLGQLAVMMAIVLVVLALVARGPSSAALLPEALPVIGVVYWALLLNGALYAQLSPGAAMAAAAAPLGSALGLASWGRRGGWRSALPACAGVLLILTPFILSAVGESLETESYYGC